MNYCRHKALDSHIMGSTPSSPTSMLCAASTWMMRLQLQCNGANSMDGVY